jgi:hypothetical protein
MTEADSLIPVRLLSVDDHPELASIDESYSSAAGIPTVLSRAAAQFHARSGHSFVAGSAGAARGFVLGHAVWTGDRPVVRVGRLAVAAAGDSGTRAALLAAVVKSAYDAGVYDLLCERPLGDEAGALALAEAGFVEQATRLHGRTLGSRGAGAAL